MKSRQIDQTQSYKRSFFSKLLIAGSIFVGCTTYALAYSPNTAGNIPGDDFNISSDTSAIIAAPSFKQKGLFFRGPQKKTAKEQLAFAQELEKNKKFKKATKAYEHLVIEWPTAPEAPTAQLGVARTLELREKHIEAYREYQYLINNYDVRHLPEGISYKDVLNGQFRIANYYLARLDSSFLGIGSIGVEGVADAFAQIAKNAPEWERASECLLKRGLAYETVGRYVDAIFEYEDLVGRYAGTDVAIEALYRAAISRHHLAMNAPRDEKTLRNAIVAMSLAMNSNPFHQYAEATGVHKKEIEAKLTALLFEKAEFYDKIKVNPKAALISYKSFVKEFPLAKEAPEAKLRIEKLEAIVSKDEGSNSK